MSTTTISGFPNLESRNGGVDGSGSVGGERPGLLLPSLFLYLYGSTYYCTLVVLQLEIQLCVCILGNLSYQLSQELTSS